MVDTILAWLKRPITELDKFIQSQSPMKYQCPACGSSQINTQGHDLALLANTDHGQCQDCGYQDDIALFKLTETPERR